MDLPKPRIFIGSSTEGLEIAKEIEGRLSKHRMFAEISVWSFHRIFKLGNHTLKSLCDVLDSYDFAIMIWTPDDEVISRGKKMDAPRDNVVLEAGLFIGRFGPERTIILCKDMDRLKIPSDLKGVTCISYNEGDTSVCTDIEHHVKELGCRYSSRSFAYVEESKADLIECIKASREIKLVGICFASLDQNIFDLLNKKAKSGTDVIICVADPRSKSVQYFRDNILYRRPTTGECPSISSVQSIWDNIHKGEHINLKLFNHASTLSISVFDNDVFIYPYGYGKLGTVSPMFHLKKDGTNRTNYFIDVADNIINSSVSVDQEMIDSF